MRCKPPCLAWVRKAPFKENLNKVVSVTKESQVWEGHLEWIVEGEGLVGRNRRDGSMMYGQTRMWCRDEHLTPISDPDIKEDDVEIVAPVVEKTEWEFPKAKEKENV